MKFLRRKSGRDEDLEHYVDLGIEAPLPVKPSASLTTSAASITGVQAAGTTAGPSPPSKDLPPTPLYAKFARMTSTTSVDSLGAPATGAFDGRAGSRFSAYNGSTASGFGASLHSATPSADSHANGPASYGRATGSSLFSGANTAAGAKSSLASASAKEPAKPEPIKLKNRRRRFDDDAPKGTSATDNAKSTATSALSRPSTATNGSSDPTPNGTPKPSMDGSTGGATGITSRASVLSNGTSTFRSAAERQVPNGATSSITHSTSLGTPSASTTPSRSTAVPTPTQPLQTDDDPNDVFSFYNAAVRMSENPTSNARPPSPARPKEGPPISLLNRAQKSHLTSETPARSSTQEQEGDILVKPPSRRESLQHAAKAAMDPIKPPVSPTVTSQRAPSPVKPRTVAAAEPRAAEVPSNTTRQPSLPTPSSTTTDSASEGGMAGVGAGARFSLQMNQPKTRPGSIQERPAPGIVFSGRSASPISQNRITASPVSIAAPSDTIVPPRAATPEHKYPTSITDKTPLVRHTSPSKVPAPSAIPTSTSSTPRASSQPIPSSATSSVSTARQSRLQNLNGRAESPTRKEEPTPASQSAARPTVTTRSNIPLPESKPISYNRGVALTDNSLPSRQNSATSVASSSVPSATRSASAITTPSGLETPDDMSSSPIIKSPESTKEVSRITLKKGGSRINGVNYSRDADITPPATASPPQKRIYSQEPIQEPVTTSRVKEEVARRESARKNLDQGHREERRQRVEAPVHVSKQEISSPPPQEPVADAYPASMSEAARYASDHGHGSVDMHSQQPIDPGMHERSASLALNNDRGYYSPQPSRSRHIPNPEYEFDPDIIYPIEQHLAVPDLLASTLQFLQFSDVLALTTVSKTVRNMLEDRKELREEILERFLGTVGYMRWEFGKRREPLVLTLRDLNSYLRGVSIPIHRYAEIAETQNFNAKEGKSRIVRLLASSTRAYSKVVLRLRVQAEMEATMVQQEESQDRSRPHSPLVRAQSPPNSSGTWKRMFHSPLYRIGHAPLLRVFIPSPDGPWLSDTSVLACEKELKRAGITQLLKIGDVVWDTAVSDEAGFGNVGRLIWDGNYLIDLDYTFSTTGDIPPYLHSLSFPPAYFHKVLRSSGNPIMQIDLRPWGREIASNLQLVQDRVQAETPQGGRHTVMRWTHRTRFQVTRSTPIPDTNLLVDAGWEGVLVLEAEGTNEGLADLQLRCGMEWFKPQPGVQPKQGDGGRVFRLIRERSRPGEIWLRTVRMKERIS